MAIDGAMIRSLADAPIGEQVEVVSGLFDVVRQLCPALGIGAGDMLWCEGHTDRHVHFRRTDGRAVVIDRFYASFIEIQAVSLPSSQTEHELVMS